MYIPRFSYDVLPADRQQALDFIRQELKTAGGSGLNGRVLVPLTRGHAGGAALQFEVELANLDQLDQFRHRGAAAPKIPITGCANLARSSQHPPVSKSFVAKSSRGLNVR